MKLHEYLGKPAIAWSGKINPFPTADFVGIEIELEDIILPRDDRRRPIGINPPEGWDFHVDDSLRNNGLEFVFSGPAAGADTANRLEKLITWIKDNKLKPDASSRTSVHVHLDAGDCTIEQLLKWILIYTVYEHLLFEVYAPERKKSNFCVPVHDSFETKKLIGFLKKSFPSFYKELGRYRGTNRYSAINIDALHKFGSLEFRHLGGTYKPKPIIDWVATLMYLKAWALNDSTDINEIFHGPSRYYCQQMTSAIFSDDIAEKMFELPNFTDLYLEGARTAQEIFLDNRIPEIPPALIPRINEIKEQKASKKVQMVKEQINKLKIPEFLDNIPTYSELLQHESESLPDPPPLEEIQPIPRINNTGTLTNTNFGWGRAVGGGQANTTVENTLTTNTVPAVAILDGEVVINRLNTGTLVDILNAERTAIAAEERHRAALERGRRFLADIVRNPRNR